MILVVDASVAALWFVADLHSEKAAQLLSPDYDLVAPDLIGPEVGSVLLRALRRKELDASSCTEALRAILPGVVRMRTAADHVTKAFDMAGRLGGSLYDAIYVVLAQSIGAPLLTGDEAQAMTARAARHKVYMIADGAPPVSSAVRQ